MSSKPESSHQSHPFDPIYDSNSRILILGTLPSVKSRENSFYYGHPQNRFWRIISTLCNERLPQTIEEKTAMLLKNNIAVWDVIADCDIIGSSDSSIRNVVPADIKGLLSHSNITHIYANGATAKKLYDRYVLTSTEVAITLLPSTSPANASYTIDRLLKSWQVILESCNI